MGSYIKRLVGEGREVKGMGRIHQDIGWGGKGRGWEGYIR